MATQTETLVGASVPDTPLWKSEPSSHVTYPDATWSNTILNYYKDYDVPPPDTLNSTLSEHEMRMIRRSDESPHIAPTHVQIRNIRGHEGEYSIGEQGFAIRRMKTISCDWRNDEDLKRVYFPEVTELLKMTTGARYVYQYEWHVRAGTLEDALKTDSKGSVDINGPVRRVHIDESPKSARNEFQYHVGPDRPGNDHLKGRPFGIFNVWKPLKTIHRDPLCLCDARTIKDQDLQLGKVTVPKVGEIENFSVRAPQIEDSHSFVYLRGQEPEEALVFRIYDSRVDGVKGDKRSHGVAHTSFVDGGTESQPARESIEVRSFCVF
jgi:hypothetical protein